jgi:hypothetical protein
MHAIEDEFLQFVHLYRFIGVTNQMQGQELFDFWRRHLRLNEIFEDLHNEITSATRYLFNRAASRGADTSERLSIISTVAVIAGLAFAALGMNVLTQTPPLAALEPDPKVRSVAPDGPLSTITFTGELRGSY